MEFTISPEVFRLFPDLKIGVIIATGIDNTGTNTGILNLLRNAEEKMRNTVALCKLAENPLISNWRKEYKLLSVKDGGPSHKAIVRRAARRNEIPHINSLVDLYNYLSLKYTIPYGGGALAKISGSMARAGFHTQMWAGPYTQTGKRCCAENSTGGNRSWQNLLKERGGHSLLQKRCHHYLKMFLTLLSKSLQITWLNFATQR